VTSYNSVDFNIKWPGEQFALSRNEPTGLALLGEVLIGTLSEGEEANRAFST
jgi:hypothetical protein